MHLWKQGQKTSAGFTQISWDAVFLKKRLGVEESLKGDLRIANSRILYMLLTDKRLVSICYDDVAERYEALHAAF